MISLWLLNCCNNSNVLLQDCFFVSAVIRKDSELKDKPVAVCHSDSPNGTSEISSANYPARDYGNFLAAMK